MDTSGGFDPSNIAVWGGISSSFSLSLLERKLDSYAMDNILSYLTLVEYSNLSIASRIMRKTVSRSTHLYMYEYGLFRKSTIPVVHHQNGEVQESSDASPVSSELSQHCTNTPQKELLRLMDRFNNLSVLNLQGLAPVGDDVIDILNRCPSALTLQSITLHSCALSYWCAHSFKLQNLQSLTLTGNSIRARMTSLLENSKNLKSLTFQQCPALRDGDIEGISRILGTSLEELVLNHTKLAKPVAYFPRLKAANFAGGFCLTSLSRFDCPNLKTLNLSFCVRLSENHIEKIMENSPTLETLIIVKCSGVHSLDLESKNLCILDASFTHNLSDLRLACPALRHLDVSELDCLRYFSKRFAVWFGLSNWNNSVLLLFDSPCFLLNVDPCFSITCCEQTNRQVAVRVSGEFHSRTVTAYNF